METSSKEPKHTGGVLAWWCPSFGTSESKFHSCLCQCITHICRAGKLGPSMTCTPLHGRARYQPSQICFPGKTCGMLPWARHIFAAGEIVARSTAIFLSEVSQAQGQWWISYGLASASDVAEWSSTHVLYRAKRVCQFQKHLSTEFLPLIFGGRCFICKYSASGSYECIKFAVFFQLTSGSNLWWYLYFVV